MGWLLDLFGRKPKPRTVTAEILFPDDDDDDDGAQAIAELEEVQAQEELEAELDEEIAALDEPPEEEDIYQSAEEMAEGERDCDELAPLVNWQDES